MCPLWAVLAVVGSSIFNFNICLYWSDSRKKLLHLQCNCFCLKKKNLSSEANSMNVLEKGGLEVVPSTKGDRGHI